MPVSCLALACLLAACSPEAPGGPVLRDAPEPGSPAGEAACLAGVVRWDTRRDPSRLDAEIRHFKALGVRTVRWGVAWVDVEKQRGTFDLDWVDAPLAALEAAGIATVVLLGYGNPLYSGRSDGDPYWPTEPAPFGAYAREVAARFGTRFAAYEIWNEPNAGYRFFKPVEDAVRFADLTVAAADGIAGACAECRVLFGGVFWHHEVIQGGVDFIREAYEARPELRTKMHGLAVHPYSLYPPEAPPDSREAPEIPLDEKVLEAARATGAQPLPETWITEMGWPVWNRTDGTGQAAHLVKAFALAARAGSRVACWYQLQDGPRAGMFPPEHDFGLLHYDDGGTASARPKAARDAMAAFEREVGPLGYSSDRVSALGLRADGDGALLFRDAAATRAATVLWRTEAADGDAVDVPLHEGMDPTLLDQTGDPLPLERQGGRVRVPLSTEPKLLVETRRP